MSYDLDQADRHIDSIVGDTWTWKRPTLPKTAEQEQQHVEDKIPKRRQKRTRKTATSIVEVH